MVAEADVRQIRSGGHLEHILETGGFAVTAEIAPPGTANPDEVRKAARLFRGSVDAVNVTDCQRALVRMSSLAAAALTMQEGVEPVMQMVLRDRNRIALQADLLGAAALGVRNVLCLRGDPPNLGNEKDALGVYDLTTEQMITSFRNLRDRGLLSGGDRIEDPPRIFIGAAANPFAGTPEESFANLRGKITAGADFVQTQAIYDVDAFDEWMRLVRKEWLHERVHILAGIIPLRSVRMAHTVSKFPGIVIPKDVLRRMETAPDPKAEGLSLAIRTIKALRKVEGVHGVHIMAVNWEDVVPLLVKETDLFPRPGGAHPTGGT